MRAHSPRRGDATSHRPNLCHFQVEAGGQRAEAAYYASVLTQLYGELEVTKLREVRANGTPTGEISQKRISALGFPTGPSPQETRSVNPM